MEGMTAIMRDVTKRFEEMRTLRRELAARRTARVTEPARSATKAPLGRRSATLRDAGVRHVIDVRQLPSRAGPASRNARSPPGWRSRHRLHPSPRARHPARGPRGQQAPAMGPVLVHRRRQPRDARGRVALEQAAEIAAERPELPALLRSRPLHLPSAPRRRDPRRAATASRFGIFGRAGLTRGRHRPDPDQRRSAPIAAKAPPPLRGPNASASAPIMTLPDRRHADARRDQPHLPRPDRRRHPGQDQAGLHVAEQRQPQPAHRQRRHASRIARHERHRRQPGHERARTRRSAAAAARTAASSAPAPARRSACRPARPPASMPAMRVAARRNPIRASGGTTAV